MKLREIYFITKQPPFLGGSRMFTSSAQPLEEAGAVVIPALQLEKLRHGKDESPPKVSTSTRQSPGLTPPSGR